jgi:hypothetical protein
MENMDRMVKLLMDDLAQRGYSSTPGGTISKQFENHMPEQRSPFAGYTPEMGQRRNEALEGLANAANAGALRAVPENAPPPETDEQTRARIAPFLAQIMKEKTLEPAGYYNGTAVPRAGSSDLNFFKKGSGTKEELKKYQEPWKDKKIQSEEGIRENYPLVEDMLGKERAQKSLASAEAQTQAMNLVKAKNQGDLKTAEEEGRWKLKVAQTKPGKEQKQTAQQKMLERLMNVAGDPNTGNIWEDDIIAGRGVFKLMPAADKTDLLNLIGTYGRPSGDRRGIHRNEIAAMARGEQPGQTMQEDDQPGQTMQEGDLSMSKAKTAIERYGTRLSEISPGRFAIDGRAITDEKVNKAIVGLRKSKSVGAVPQ